MKLRFVVYGICLVVILFFVLFDSLREFHHIEADEQSSKRVKTYNGMLDVSSDIQVFAYFSEKEVPREMSRLIAELREFDKESFELLAVHVDPNMVTGVYSDAWGRPVQLLVESPSKYTFHSFGANGIDDDRESDDIVYSFNPLASLEKKTGHEGTENPEPEKQ